MRKKGSKLNFISRIDRHGLRTHKVPEVELPTLNKEVFKINSLSVSNETFIASGFNSYVVKLKPKKQKK